MSKMGWFGTKRTQSEASLRPKSAATSNPPPAPPVEGSSRCTGGPNAERVEPRNGKAASSRRTPKRSDEGALYGL